MTNTALPRHSESGYFQNISVDGSGHKPKAICSYDQNSESVIFKNSRRIQYNMLFTSEIIEEF